MVHDGLECAINKTHKTDQNAADENENEDGDDGRRRACMTSHGAMYVYMTCTCTNPAGADSAVGAGRIGVG